MYSMYQQQADPACLQTSKFPIPLLMLYVKSATDLSACFLGQLRGEGDMWHSAEATGSLDFPVSPLKYEPQHSFPFFTCSP